MKEPTKTELEILKIIWNKNPITVRQIHEALDKSKSYTNTLKLIQIMYSKGMLKRMRDGVKHLYSPNINANQAQQLFTKKIKDNLYGGSSFKLALGILGNEKISNFELQELKDFVKKMEEDND